MMSIALFAQILLQSPPGVLLRSDKIFAVMAVLLVIFGGILFYLIRTGRKARELEARLDQLAGPDQPAS